MSLVEAMPVGAACKPNISSSGRKRRRAVGYVSIFLALMILGLVMVVHAPWYLAGLVFFPGAMAGFGFFQARRNTCVARAKEGTFENEDFSTVPAPEEEVIASRRVAAGIQRDAMLLGLGSAMVAIALALAAAGHV